MLQQFKKGCISSTYKKVQKQPPQEFYKKDIFEHFAKFTGKHLCQSLFFKRLQAWGLQFYQKRNSDSGLFPVNFAKFSKTTFLKKTSERLLLMAANLRRDHYTCSMCETFSENLTFITSRYLPTKWMIPYLKNSSYLMGRYSLIRTGLNCLHTCYFQLLTTNFFNL